MEKSPVSPQKIKVWTLALLIGATLLFIFGNSMLDAAASTEQSDSAYELFSWLFSRLTVLFPDLSFRKLAHFTEFALLGGELFLLGGFFRAPYVPLGALPLSFLVACTDELLIQRRVPGRSGEWRDVWIDTAGAIVGMILVFLWILIKERIAGKKKRVCEK